MAGTSPAMTVHFAPLHPPDAVGCLCSVPLNPEGPRPSEALFGLSARTIFARDPISVADTIQHLEYRRVVDFPFVRLVSRRHGGNLHMTDEVQIFFESDQQVPAHDLVMV